MKGLCFLFFEPVELPLVNSLGPGMGFVVGVSRKGNIGVWLDQ